MPLFCLVTGRLNVKQEEIDEMLKEASGPINFTVFLTMFGEKLKGRFSRDETLAWSWTLKSKFTALKINAEIWSCCLYRTSNWRWWCFVQVFYCDSESLMEVCLIAGADPEENHPQRLQSVRSRGEGDPEEGIVRSVFDLLSETQTLRHYWFVFWITCIWICV